MTARHLMIDIETLGTGGRAPIIAFGAVLLSDKPDNDTFYCAIRPSLSPPYEPDFDTLAWWTQQSEEARKVFRATDAITPLGFCVKFLAWWNEQGLGDGRSVKVWAKPPRFDIAIVEHMLRAEGYSPPWKHQNVLDMRTIIFLADPEGNLKPPPNEGHHNALADAMWQAQYLQRLLTSDDSP